MHNMTEAAVVFDELLSTKGRFIGRATLNSPKSLNALSLTMCELLLTQLQAWRENPKCIAIFLEGSGDKAFCAGGDVVQLYKSILQSQESGDANTYCEQYFATDYRLDYLIHPYGKPVICWGQGYVMGGGIGLISGASHRVATEASRMSMPEISIGLYPDVGGTYFLNRAPGKLGLFMGLSAYQMNAHDALFTGLADRFIEHKHKASVLDALLQTAWGDASNHAAQISTILRTFEKQSRAALAPLNLWNSFELINTLMDGDEVETVVRQLQEVDTDLAWLNKAKQIQQKGCPTTAHLVFEQLRRGKHLSLKEVFQMELVLSTRCCYAKDFAEGVRALLVDKDGKPVWQHKSVSDVNPHEINLHFESPWTAENHPLAKL